MTTNRDPVTIPYGTHQVLRALEKHLEEAHTLSLELSLDTNLEDFSGPLGGVRDLLRSAQVQLHRDITRYIPGTGGEK